MDKQSTEQTTTWRLVLSEHTGYPVQCLSIFIVVTTHASSTGRLCWVLNAAFRILLCILGLLINTRYTHTARTSCRQVLLHEDSVSTIRHVLDGIVVKDLARLPGVAPLPQQIPQGLIVHLNEGGLHVIFPPRICQLACSFQDLQTTDMNRQTAYSHSEVANLLAAPRICSKHTYIGKDFDVVCLCIIEAIVRSRVMLCGNI